MPLPEVASVPSINQNNKVNNFKANRIEYIFDNILISKIKDFCTKNNISVFNFLMGIYSIYFGRINNMENFLVGTPILNRTSFAQKHTSRYVY